MSPTARTASAPGWTDRLRVARRRSIKTVGKRLTRGPDRQNCFIRVADRHHHWEPGRSFAFGDTYEHEVRNDTDQHRVVLIFHANRPMRWPGHAVNRVFQGAVRRSAYVQDPLRNLSGWADRFEKAVARASSRKGS